jgi:hypothetical protein
MIVLHNSWRSGGLGAEAHKAPTSSSIMQNKIPLVFTRDILRLDNSVIVAGWGREILYHV